MGLVTEREGNIVVRANDKDRRFEQEPSTINISFRYKNIKDRSTSSKAKQEFQMFDLKAWCGIGVEI